MNYSLKVQQDSDGELFLEFPENLLNQMGWDVGDKLIWNELPEGTWTIEKDNKDE